MLRSARSRLGLGPALTCIDLRWTGCDVLAGWLSDCLWAGWAVALGRGWVANIVVAVNTAARGSARSCCLGLVPWCFAKPAGIWPWTPRVHPTLGAQAKRGCEVLRSAFSRLGLSPACVGLRWAEGLRSIGWVAASGRARLLHLGGLGGCIPIDWLGGCIWEGSLAAFGRPGRLHLGGLGGCIWAAGAAAFERAGRLHLGWWLHLGWLCDCIWAGWVAAFGRAGVLHLG